jgi:hypothetical protein
MKGSRRWCRRRRLASERYWRRYGYASEAALQRWRWRRKCEDTVVDSPPFKPAGMAEFEARGFERRNRWARQRI